jgi:hypothetical protein
MDASPLHQPGDSSRLVAFCELVEEFKRILESQSTETLVASVLRDHRNRAQLLVSSMTVEECVYLLQTWLLSLCMNDISFFITLSPLEAINVEGDFFLCSVLTTQTAHAAGELTVSTGSRQWPIRYKIKVIDCDQKPSRKLRSRGEKEKYFTL